MGTTSIVPFRLPQLPNRQPLLIPFLLIIQLLVSKAHSAKYLLALLLLLLLACCLW
jgi:hypothetical protein